MRGHTPIRSSLASRPCLWAAGAALLLHACCALAQANRLEFEALVQEGDLILDEVAVLKPVGEKLASEGKQVAQADRKLRDDAKALETSIQQFNAAMDELNAGAKERSEQCPAQIADPALLETCNARARQLIEQQQTLAEQRGPLGTRQQELNARIDKHNVVAKDYDKRNQEFSHRDMLNQRDSEDWLERARAFFSSESTADLVTSAGNPAACSSERLAELAKPGAVAGLKRAQACLKAIKAAIK